MGGGLSFDAALQMTLIQSPVIKTSLYELGKGEGEVIQSGLFFNPLFSYSVENVFGNKDWRGWKSAEQRVEISQAFYTTCRREHEVNRAKWRVLAIQSEQSYVEYRVVNEMKKAFLEVVAAQEMLSLATHAHEIAQAFLRAIQVKSEGGKVRPIEINKGLLGLANSEIALQKAITNLEVARNDLALFWGESCPDFDCLEFPFYDLQCPPLLDDCLTSIDEHPLLLKVQCEQMVAFNEIKLQKALAFPDLIVTAGYKTLQRTHERGMILGIAFPLAIFNRNQGNCIRAEAESSCAYNLFLEQQLALQVRMTHLHKQAMQSYFEVVQFETAILKLAEESFKMVQEGYMAGKYEYLDLLEAERTYFDTKERYIAALLSFYQKQIDIEYLIL